MTDQRLIDALCEALLESFGEVDNRGADRSHLAPFVAQRLESKVIWRDDLQQIDEVWHCADGCGSGSAHTEDCRPEAVFVLRAGSEEQMTKTDSEIAFSIVRGLAAWVIDPDDPYCALCGDYADDHAPHCLYLQARDWVARMRAGAGGSG